MGRRVRGDGWSILLPEGMTGWRLERTHTHLRTMTQFRGLLEDGSDLEVIVTTYPGEPTGERRERLDRGGEIWAVPGARVARRRSQLTQLDSDLDAPRSRRSSASRRATAIGPADFETWPR
jgi:hypothetical protein